MRYKKGEQRCNQLPDCPIRENAIHPSFKQKDRPSACHGYGFFFYTFKFVSKISILSIFLPNQLGPVCIMTPNYCDYSITSNLIKSRPK